MKNKPFWKRLFVLLLVLVLLFLALFIFFRKEDLPSAKDWLGVWEVTYYYKNEPQILFEGNLKVELKDSLRGVLEIYPLKASKPEFLKIRGLSIDENTLSIKGQIVHDKYMINGGYNKEAFSFELTSSDEFTGKGICLEFCAEGTEGVEIIWGGVRER